MIQAIFFATFDVNEGPKVLHQVPASSITASPSTPSIPLLHFPSISSLIIPHPTLCNNGLVHFTTTDSPRHRILSYPQHIASSRYPRNAYTFNFCLVLPAGDNYNDGDGSGGGNNNSNGSGSSSTGGAVDFNSYIPVVRKLNLLFRSLEEQEQFLSRDVSAHRRDGSESKIYKVCEILLSDLNNYCEAMIPIDSANTLNIKLFPTYPPPPPLYAHHVPLATVRLDAGSPLVDDEWDLTLLKVLPYIDGVNSVKQIALRADADFKLVKKAVRHLLYYGCVVLLDVFSFGGIYACTSAVGEIVESEALREECRRYVSLEEDEEEEEEGGGDGGGMRAPFQWRNKRTAAGKEESKEHSIPITGTDLATLYLSLKQGQSVKNWCMERPDIVSKIDIRRFITFGIIKGFLYRVHKYAFLPPSSSKQRLTKANLRRSGDGYQRTGSGVAVKGGDGVGEEGEEEGVGDEAKEADEADLLKYLDGTHCFDEICTDLMISEKELVMKLKGLGDVQVICR
ncbi:Nitrogen permease regulator 2 [Lecanora helva]